MRRLLVSLLAALLLAAGVSPAKADKPDAAGLRVIAFNVLAPIWAAPKWYPNLDPALLDTAFRRERIVAFLQEASRSADVVCLQEVQIDELPHFEAALGTEFSGKMAVNDAAYWSNWVVDALPWRPNGPAVFVRTSALAQPHFADLALSGNGNHAAAAEGLHTSTGKPVRVVSVHLDSDHNANRAKELRSLMEQMPKSAGTVDIVCGDLNK